MNSIFKYINNMASLVLLAVFGFCATVKAQDMDAIVRQVDSLSSEANYTEAIALLEKHISLFKSGTPYEALAWSRLGVYHYNLKDFEKAKTCCQKYLDSRKPYLESNPAEYGGEYLDCLSFLLNIYGELSDYRAAIHVCKESIELIERYREYFENYPSVLAGTYGNLSWYYLCIKDYPLAGQTVQKALNMDETQTWVKTNLAHALLFQGKTQEAETVYNELIQTVYNGNDTYASILLGDFERLEKAKAIPREAKQDVERIKINMSNIYETEKAVNGLYAKGREYENSGDYAQAEKYYLEAKEIREKVFGKEHPVYAFSLNSLGYFYNFTGNYVQAGKYYLETKEVIEKVFGKEHPDYAGSLNSLGEFYRVMGDYEQAEKYHVEAKEIIEKVFGKEHLDFAISLNNLGMLYYDRSNYAQAEKYYIEAKEIEEKVLGKEHPDYATPLNNLGMLYNTTGDYAQAEKYLIEAKEVREKVLGKESLDYAISLNNLGLLYYNRGNYDSAKKYYLEAKEIGEKVLGKKHPDYAVSLNNLGLFYDAMGDYIQAERYYVEAKEIQGEILGKKHPSYAISLGNLGALYHAMGDYTQADKYYLEAKEIRENVLGKMHPDYAASLNMIGALYDAMGDHAQAEKYYVEVNVILEKTLGKEHPYYATSLDNLARLYHDIMGDFMQAEKYYLEAKKIREKVLGKAHPNYAVSLNNLGRLYNDIGYFVHAEKYFLEAKEITEKVLGKEHPDYGLLLQNLFALYYSMRDYEKATAFGNAASELSIQITGRNFAFMSEQQRNLYWETQRTGFEAGYSLSQFHPVTASNILNYNNTLFSKGLLLRTANAVRDAIYSSGNQVLIGQYEQLGSLRREINTLRQGTDFNKEYVASLESRADSLDRALTRASVKFRDLKADISMQWQDVQRQLNPEDAAVEFVHYRLLKRGSDSTLYAALVLRKDMDAPVWIPLCEQEQLQAVLHTDSRDTQEQTETLYSEKGAQLYQLVWSALEKELPKVKNVYYSPSGLLHKIAFNALPANEDSLLLSDRYNLHPVSSTREIARLKKETSVAAVRDSVAVYGGLTYDVPRLSMVAAARPYNGQKKSSHSRYDDRFRKRDAGLPDADLRSGFSEWQYLAGTKTETEQIVGALTGKRIPHRYYTEQNGNEESFKDLSGTQTDVIHLATHGFFLPDAENNRAVDEIVRRLGGNSEKPFENPLLRSGLIMSGANLQWRAREYITEEDIEDGILTADEISRLNLTKTKLVALSACETGLGDVKNSEGVFGLQRAFKLAGVESLIMSLWKVPDKATAELMTAFYDAWLAGNAKQDAFRKAQQKVRAKYKSPYYWAAFVMLD